MPRTRKRPEIPAPDGLSERAQALWHAVVPTRGVSPGRLVLIGEALRALDRADEAAAIVDAEGMSFTTETTKTVHLHPLVKVEREQRQLFAKLWSSMCHLEWDSQTDGRVWD